MKLFKKALVATAILGAFGAQAATVKSDNILNMSQQGVAQGLEENATAVSFDIIVSKAHPAASTITLTFDSKVDLTPIEGTITNVVDNSTLGLGDAGDLDFNYGNGNFTFDNVVVDTDTDGKHSISFDVNLGNPLDADSAFRVTLAAGVVIKGASVVSYSSKKGDGTAIETGTGAISKEVDQFSFEISTPFDGLITRTTQTTFTDTTDTDSLTFKFTNDETLAAALTGVDATVVFSGNFEDTVTAEYASSTFNAGAFNTAPALNGDEDEITVVVTDSAGLDGANADGTANTVVLTYDENDALVQTIPITGDITAKVTFTPDAGDAVVYVTKAEAGEWALDATVINVPYFPVGFTGVDTSIHFANESSNDADVIISAIDGAGNTYSSTAMPDLAGKSVTKLSQTKLMEYLGITAPTKLSVTFNIDSNVGDVNAYAFSNAGDARQALVTSQEKGSDK